MKKKTKKAFTAEGSLVRDAKVSDAKQQGREGGGGVRAERVGWWRGGGKGWEGLKGRDLSGLDCVLIEVTCIKWNLIGTDTGSLTDRHDADGLRGGERRGREGGKWDGGGGEAERQRRRDISFAADEH